MLAAALMLDHTDKMAEATRLRNAIDATLLDKTTRTRDLGGSGTTEDFTQAVIAKLK